MTLLALRNEINALLYANPECAHRVVVSSIDPEGNGFHELSDYCLGFYSNGEFTTEIDDLQMFSTVPQPAICLWP